MKIVFLNFHSGYRSRGGETFVHELASRLAKNNEVILFQAGPKVEKGKYKTEVVDGFVHPDKIGFVSRSNLLGRLFLDRQRFQELVFSLKALSRIRKLRPDVVIPLNGAWQALIFSLYCRFAGSRLVIAGQSGPGWDDRFNLLFKPNLFVVLTNRQLEWAKGATIWNQEFALIGNGVDLDQFKPAAKKIKLDLEKPIIMMVAASTPDKRVEQGIRSAAKLSRGSLLLLGKGPLDERIDKLGYKLLGKDRFFHTAVPHEQMAEYYRSADLFTLCSESSEAFGIVYLEAMATNLPVVATDDASRREIVDGAGLFVKNPNDEEEYAEVIKEALKKKWGDIPRKQAAKYSWDKIAEKYEKILRQI